MTTDSLSPLFFEAGASLGQYLWDKAHPTTDEHPGDRYIIFTFRNATHENLHDVGSMFQHGARWYPKRPVPGEIPARKSARWTATNHEYAKGAVEGSTWYQIGTSGQINIDFKNAPFNSDNYFNVYTNNSDRYVVYCKGNNDFGATVEIMLGYNNHDTKINNVQLRDAPACATFSKDNKIYCFHQDNDGSGGIWYNIFNGSNWEGDRQIREPSNHNPRMHGRAATVEFKDKLYCLYQGTEGRQLWFTTFDGQKWSWASNPNTGLVESPTAVVYRDRLYCLHQDAGNEGKLWCNTYDGSNWSGDTLVRNETIMSESPSAVVLDDKLYCFFQGPGQNGELKYVVFDGTSWTEPKKIDGVGMSDSPTAVVVDGKIRIYHHGFGHCGQLWSVMLGDESGNVPVVGVGISYSPAVAVYNGKVHCTHHGFGASSELWHITLPFNH